ncbi:OBAP family protein [Paraliomyxa miuraensis]|uniref:OBAP family protein n=1 Tax=Paraliomyxa miuraensis TaxID=376150 RepID=UPI00225375F4|nr:OBAP family protein [Paraliomyxa miuraensis]
MGFALAACGEQPPPAVEPAGEPETTKTKVLETGARVLQRAGPAATLDLHLVGYHPLFDDPHDQLEAHHYCKQVNEDFAQCALWDSNREDANLNGIEYIISQRLFDGLPPEEQQYWHPHDYEILSGQLVAPGLPELAELALMKGKMNSYGKTWHLWNTGADPDALPMGPPRLAWSFNADGEIDPALLEQRDRVLKLDTDQIRHARQALVPLAEPQRGVDALADAFPQRSKPAGVMSAK